MKPPYQMISQDEAKLYRERAEKAEAEVERLRLKVTEQQAQQLAALLPMRDETVRLRAALGSAKRYWQTNDDGHKCGGKSGEWCDGCLLRDALRTVGIEAS